MLKCRLVCTQWCKGVDTFVENFYSIISPDKPEGIPDHPEEHLPNLNFKAFHFEYNFSIPPPPQDELDSSDSDQASNATSLESINRSHDRVRHKMILHTRNPFIGRSVTIEEESDDYEELPRDNFVTQSSTFLNDFGTHIWHLSICCNMDNQTPSRFYQVMLQSIIKCQSLRSLCLGAELNWRVRRNVEDTRISQLPEPEDRPTLESLQVDMDNQRVFVIQNKIVQKYSNQLKRLEVQLWEPVLYCQFPWSCLRELQVNKGKADEFLDSLLKLHAPNLRTLMVQLDGRGPYLPKLIKLTNHFPKLNHMVLRLESRYADILTTKEDLQGIPLDLTCSSKLTTLELTSSVTDVASYDFLVYLPFLQRLLIRHGHWTNYNLRDATAHYMTRQSRVQQELGSNKQEIIKISKYIIRDGVVEPEVKGMYKSKVWNVLPFLQSMEICNARFVPEKRRLYTREAYEYYRDRD